MAMNEEQQRAAAEQEAAWNGPSGDAWIASQEALDELFAAAGELLVEAASAHGARSVLDVGCGTGATTLAIAQRLGAGASCTGVDISAPMIEVARARAQGQADGQATFAASDAATYAFEPDAFDLVVSRFGVMFFADPVAAFTNLRGATAPGGGLFALVWRSPSDNEFMRVAARAAAPVLPEGALPEKPAPRAPGQFAFADPEYVREILASSGWADVSLEARDVPCAMPASELEAYVTRLGPLGQVLRDGDAATRERILGAVLPAFEPYVEGGVVRFDAGLWVVRATA